MLLGRLSIAPLVSAALVLVTTGMLAAFGAFNYAMERDRQWADLRGNLLADSAQLSSALTLPVWNIDEGEIGKVIESAMLEEDVYGIVVQGAGKIYARARDRRWRVVPVEGDFFASDLLVRETPVTFGGDTVGSVKVCLTPRFVEQRLRHTLVTTVTQIVLLDLFLVGSLYLLLWRVVLKPLRSVERYAAAVSSGAGEAVAAGGRFPGELENLRNSIEKMVALLAARYQELQLSEERFRTIFENAPVGIFQSSLEGRLASANATYARIFGYGSGEEASRELADLEHQVYVHPEQRAEIIASARQGEGYHRRELESLRSDGSQLFINLYFRGVRTSGGEPAYLEGFVEDITERKHAEKELLRAKLFVDAILESLPGVFYLFDDRLNLIRWNRNFETLTGYCAAELASHHALDHVAEEDKERLFATIEDLLTYGGSSTDEATAVGRLGERTPYCVTAALWESEGAKYLLGTGIDITERKHAEQEVQQLLAQVQQDAAQLEKRVAERTAQLKLANEQLESFAYSVSHDLKAPLRGIDGYSRLLQEDYAQKLDEDGRFFVGNIRSGAQQMTQLIDDLLAYSRLERRTLSASTIRIPTFAQGLLGPYRPQLEARGVAVTVKLAEASLSADADALAMALRNLFDNAIKFTGSSAEPAIEIGGEVAQSSYLLWVRDNGIGFDMQYKERIFEIFQRLQRAEEYPGTGVGLALVRKAMERMGGRVWAESVPGQGATFYLEVPL
jgi:PAS domain S-box-containing protein